MFKITYQDDSRVVQVDEPNTTILKISLANQIPHYRECGGQARCTTCRVRILDGLGNLSRRTAREDQIAKERGWDPFVRLACQTVVQGNVMLRRLVRSGEDFSQLMTEKLGSEVCQELPLAILFCDIRGFTPFAEKHLPYDVVHILNRFYALMGDPIHLNNGLIHLYMGDGMLAVFGVGGDPPMDSCLNAVRAGLGMLSGLNRVNDKLAGEFGVTLNIGIGVHFGRAILGTVGHASNRQLSVIGDAVNTASRIESLNKRMETQFLISGEVMDHIPMELAVGKGARVRLKGKTNIHRVHEVLGMKGTDNTLLVQSSLRHLVENQDVFSEDFYSRVFAKAPSVREMFRGNMQAQGRMIVQMLQSAVGGLRRSGDQSVDLVALGRRHRGYGVSVAHYPVVREAFVEAIEKLLGPMFGESTVQAWATTLDTIVAGMLQGHTES